MAVKHELYAAKVVVDSSANIIGSKSRRGVRLSMLVMIFTASLPDMDALVSSVILIVLSSSFMRFGV